MVTTKNMDNSIALIQIHMKKYKEYAGFTEQEKEHLFGIVEQELELLYRKIRIIEKMTTQEDGYNHPQKKLTRQFQESEEVITIKKPFETQWKISSKNYEKQRSISKS